MSTAPSAGRPRPTPPRWRPRRPPGSDAVAAAPAREAARVRRRVHGHECRGRPGLGPADEEPVASTAASDRGAGKLGFAGAAAKETAPEAAGLTTLPGDEFGGGPRMPMLPGTWDPDDTEETSEGESR